MVERLGTIRHQEGNIVGKEQKRSIASEIVKRERDAYKKVLGIEPEIKPLSEYVTPEVIKNLKNFGMGLRFIPKLNLGTLNELKAVGEEEFLKKLEKRYPNWRRHEGLSDMEKKDHSISRNLNQWYWRLVKNEKVDFPQLKSQWMAVETMPKPSYREKYESSHITYRLRLSDRFGVSSHIPYP